MKQSASIFLVCLMLGSVDGISIGKTVAAQTTPNNCVEVGTVASIQGKVKLKREGLSDYEPTSVGTVLCQGDLLLPAPGAIVSVVCNNPDRTSWPVPPGRPSGAANGCAKPQTPRSTSDGDTVPNRHYISDRTPRSVPVEK